MKIIHCADLHLDSKMTANLSKEQAKERKMEILRTFSRMVDYAAKNGVRVVIIAGDLFDTRNVSATARNLVRDTILQHPHIDFLYLKGNHDYDNFLSKLDEIPENLKLFEDSWKSYSYGNVVISGLELSKENQVTAYNSLVLDHGVYNVVTLHGQITDYGIKDKAEIINLDSLKNKNIDYLALGHVHEYQAGQLDARGVYCYSGCLEGRGFDECGDKGFVLCKHLHRGVDVAVVWCLLFIVVAYHVTQIKYHIYVVDGKFAEQVLHLLRFVVTVVGKQERETFLFGVECCEMLP